MLFCRRDIGRRAEVRVGSLRLAHSAAVQGWLLRGDLVYVGAVRLGHRAVTRLRHSMHCERVLQARVECCDWLEHGLQDTQSVPAEDMIREVCDCVGNGSDGVVSC